MSDATQIEWTDATWNPVVGCTKVSAGCANCYAARLAATRLAHLSQYAGLAEMTPSGARWTGEVRCLADRLMEPFHWRKPRRVFVCSMADLFHEDVPDEFIAQVFGVMVALTPDYYIERGRPVIVSQHHTFQILTKRPERMRALLSDGVFPGLIGAVSGIEPVLPMPHVWIGVTAENQAAADERIPILLDTPAAVRFVSCEPLLGPVDLNAVPPLVHGCAPGAITPCALGWVIVGGETGPGARPMDPDWARSLRDQCQGAGVPFFMKQLSGRAPIPDDLLVREWPGGAP